MDTVLRTIAAVLIVSWRRAVLFGVFNYPASDLVAGHREACTDLRKEFYVCILFLIS